MKTTYAFVVIILCVAITYAPLVTGTFAFGDDFLLFFSEEDLSYAYLADGRPLFGLAQAVFHAPVQTLEQLRWFRGATAAGVAGMMILLWTSCNRLFSDRTWTTCVLVAAATLPCLHTYVAQANFWLCPIAGCLAIIAAQRMVLTQSPGFGSGIVAISLMLVVGAIYQPMLSWYWVVIGLGWLGVLTAESSHTGCDNRTQLSAESRQLWRAMIVGFAAYLACFLAMKAYFIIFGATAKPRTLLATNPIDKLYWLLRIQVPQSLNFWHLIVLESRVVPLGIAALVGSVIAGGWFIRFRSGSQIWFKIFIGFSITAILSHSHWLLIADNPQSYRVIAPMGTLAWIVFAWGIAQWLSLKPSLVTSVTAGTRGWRAAIPIAIAAMAMMICQQQALRYWILPHETSYRFLMFEIRDRILPSSRKIHLVRERRSDGLVYPSVIESFGCPATERDWMVESMVRQALRQTGHSSQIESITHDVSSIDGAREAATQPIDTLVIDMRRLVLFRDRVDSSLILTKFQRSGEIE